MSTRHVALQGLARPKLSRRRARCSSNTGHMAINSRPRADRGSSQQYGFCLQGCRSGAKWSTLSTEIPAAENPTLTVVTLALRQADEGAGDLKKALRRHRLRHLQRERRSTSGKSGRE